MAASRLSQFSSFIFHPLRLRPHSISTLRLPPKPYSLSSSQLYATSAAVSIDGAFQEVPPAHPWPEWERFLEKLKSKGYFDNPDEREGSVRDAASMELHRVKTACLNFARERVDILKLLTKQDIQAVVECGCPNLYRKAVNSAKRLRAFLRLDEGDVCSGCNLRGSCDRAYVIAKEDEGARTVDIMRILLNYAVDPLSLSAKEKPLGGNHVEESACNLLSQLVKLSEVTPDPALPQAAKMFSTSEEPKTPKEPSRHIKSREGKTENVEMKRGDWLCPNCDFLNFARNLRCLQCKEDGPKRVNFGNAEMKPGDWTCPRCQFMNFARNRKCFRCQQSRPKRELNPGEWECPSCDIINFRRNLFCFKCNCERPKDEGQGTDHVWRRPKAAGEKYSSTMNFGEEEEEEEDDDLDADILGTSRRKMR